MDLLGKITIRHTEHVGSQHGHSILHVRDPHALIQAAGYLKFVCGARDELVFFRGQSRMYPALAPTLFRGIAPTQSAQGSRVHDCRSFIEEIAAACQIFGTFPDFAHEPLLQHYGLSTTWMDLVDNIWVALWFACHKAHVSGKKSQYLHFEQRIPGPDEFA